MSEVLQANVFFFITGIAVIVFTLLLSIALYHIIRILKSLRRVMDKIEIGSEIIAEDMQSVREYFTEKSLFSRVLGGMLGTSGKHSSKMSSPVKRTAQPEKKVERKVQKTILKIKGEE